MSHKERTVYDRLDELVEAAPKFVLNEADCPWGDLDVYGLIEHYGRHLGLGPEVFDLTRPLADIMTETYCGVPTDREGTGGVASAR